MDAYIHGNNSYSSKSMMITEEIVHFLNDSLTKTQLIILKTLYENGELQHKALAVSVNTSPTSLSNHLNKLESIQPTLLNIAKDGRAKYYSLTPFAKTYIEHEAQFSSQSNIYDFTKPTQNSELTKEALNLLTKFQYIAGFATWRIKMDHLLSEQTFHTTSELSETYLNFMNVLKELKIQGKAESLHIIYDKLEQPNLANKIESKLEPISRNYRAIKPLLDLEKQDMALTYQIIDTLFKEKYPNAFNDVPNDAFIDISLIQDEQYYSLYYSIDRMAEIFIQCNYRKEQAIAQWQTTYFANSHCFYYIAEKYRYLHKEQHL